MSAAAAAALTSPDMLATLRAELGIVRQSDWLVVDQAMIDGFADVTLDRQYIHVDPQRAATTPFGGTVAHGFLTLSLLSHLAETSGLKPPSGLAMSVNYGFDRIRFVHPVRAGSRIRAVSTVTEVEGKRPGQFQQVRDVVIEIEGVARPALTATWLCQYLV